ALRAMLVNSGVTSTRKSLSAITEGGHMSMMVGTCAMETVQISMQARQLVQDHKASVEMMPPTIGWWCASFSLAYSSALTPAMPSLLHRVFSPRISSLWTNSASLTPRIISLGKSGLPVLVAGQTVLQRPHSVQAYPSSSCFHVNCSGLETP